MFSVYLTLMAITAPTKDSRSLDFCKGPTTEKSWGLFNKTMACISGDVDDVHCCMCRYYNDGTMCLSVCETQEDQCTTLVDLGKKETTTTTTTTTTETSTATTTTTTTATTTETSTTETSTTETSTTTATTTTTMMTTVPSGNRSLYITLSIVVILSAIVVVVWESHKYRKFKKKVIDFNKSSTFTAFSYV